MKKLIGILLLGLFLVLPLVGDWYWNKYTGKLDYYERSTASPWFTTVYLYDLDLSNKLAISWPENDILDRTLKFYVNGANRIINLSGDFTLSGSNQVANWTATTATYSPAIYGGTGVGGDLNLYSTSNATKGTITVNDPLEIIASARNLKTWWNFEEFIELVANSRCGIWTALYSGTGASCSSAIGTAARPGIAQLVTGTTNAGTAYLYTGTTALNGFLFGAGVYTIEGDIYINTLSDGTETYALRFGFGDLGTGAPVDGAFFYYSDIGGGGATPNWYRCTVSNSVQTTTDTGVAVIAGAWIRLKVIVNADATSVEYFINGISVGSNVANIPTGAGRETGAIYSIVKSAGITTRAAKTDWIWLHIDLTTSR